MRYNYVEPVRTVVITKYFNFIFLW